MIYEDEKLHNKYVINIIFDGASPWNYLQTTEMGSLMRKTNPDPWSASILQLIGQGEKFPRV